MSSAQELVASCDQLFSLPEIYVRVRDVVNDPNSSVADLAKVLALDPAITARILQAVNSPLYGLPRHVGSLAQAVNMLGMHAIQDIVLTTSVTKAFPKIPASVMNMTEYWRRSVRCGLLADGFAKAAKLEHADECFILGLLREVGHLVMYQTVPERVQSALIEASHLSQPLAEVEQENIGCDYAEVGAELMQRWGMPAHFEAIIRHQSEPTNAGDAAPYAQILFVSGRLSDLLETQSVDEAFTQADTTAALHALGASAEQARDIVMTAEAGLKDMLAIIYPRPLASAA
ncbi:MAG: HDOD domain-containing protein [Nitrospiraceae bacterium]